MVRRLLLVLVTALLAVLAGAAPAQFAADSEVPDDGGGWCGITPAHNVDSPAEVDAVGWVQRGVRRP